MLRFHNIAYQFHHVQLRMIAVTLNDAVKSLSPNESWIEPHTPFLDGG